jgi:hypothetical protein
MKIAFFTEMEFYGKVPRTHNNMRTEFAWMCALNADHYNIQDIPIESYDLGIVIIPKKNPNFDINNLKLICNKIAVMQEGPNWYWQDYSLEQQIWYFNTLVSADIIYTHNQSDQKYYKGLTTHPDVRVMPSLMIEDVISKNIDCERSGVIIGGNMTSWYSGFDSMMIAQEFGEQIYVPSMGRKIDREDELDITHLPYMNWTQWIYELNKFKYGVHLMRTHAAGTFALNCAYLGIPCIGYEGLDTQEICHPETTVKLGDLMKARDIAKELSNNEKFYIHCSKITKQLYQEKYHENQFYTTFSEQFKVS